MSADVVCTTSAIRHNAWASAEESSGDGTSMEEILEVGSSKMSESRVYSIAFLRVYIQWSSPMSSACQSADESPCCEQDVAV